MNSSEKYQGTAFLRAIVGVAKEKGVMCQQPGCRHRVYARIHIVEEEGRLLVLGSSCFAKRYGSAEALGKPSSSTSIGRQLTDEERQMMLDNTTELLAHFQRESEKEKASMLARLQFMKATIEARQPLAARPTPRAAWTQASKRPPWPWVKPMSSVAYFRMKDGTGWVRVQSNEGLQMLMPWPTFQGWDEVFPPSVGVADPDLGGYRVSDIVHAVAYLRERSAFDRVGNWNVVDG
jgi:hypothetical protein